MQTYDIYVRNDPMYFDEFDVDAEYGVLPYDVNLDDKTIDIYAYTVSIINRIIIQSGIDNVIHINSQVARILINELLKNINSSISLDEQLGDFKISIYVDNVGQIVMHYDDQVQYLNVLYYIEASNAIQIDAASDDIMLIHLYRLYQHDSYNLSDRDVLKLSQMDYQILE